MTNTELDEYLAGQINKLLQARQALRELAMKTKYNETYLAQCCNEVVECVADKEVVGKWIQANGIASAMDSMAMNEIAESK